MVLQQWHNAFKLSTRAFLSKRQFVSEWLNAFKYRLICMIRDGDSMNIHTNVEIINGGGFIKTKYVIGRGVIGCSWECFPFRDNPGQILASG